MRDASVGHQCPECVAEGQRSTRSARTAFGGKRSGAAGRVTITLIAANVLVMILGVIAAGGGGLAGGGLGGLFSGATSIHTWGAVLGYATYVEGGPVHGVAAGEYYRLFTSMFIHYGILHLVLNMWALWVLGRNLEFALGPGRFLALYLLSGLGGSVAVYVFASPADLTAGASGAIFGLFAAFFIILKRLGRDTSAIVPILVINLVLTFAVPSISIAGHLGGLVSGAIVGAGLAYAPAKNRTAVQILVCAAFALLLVALTLTRTSSLTG